MQTFSKTHATFINLRHLNLNIDIIFSQEDTEWVMGLVNILELAPLLEELELHVSDSSRIVKWIVVLKLMNCWINVCR
jgi:hypothetical protein